VRIALLALAAALLVTCVPAPSDPIDFGELCVPPQADCQQSVVLERTVTGRNEVDWLARNVGTGVAVIEILALVPGAEDLGFDELDPALLVARREHLPLQAGDEVDGRFTPQDLGVRDGFVFAARCGSCEAEIEWVFATVPRECFEDEDCIAGWQCDDAIGRCVECLVNADCNEDQVCDLESGRCNPPETRAGCNTAPRPPSAAFLLFAILIFCRRRRFVAFLLVGALWSAPASASPPRASLSVGTGARFLSGELGEQTRRGVGFTIGQELRWRHVGAGISLGTSYFLTAQQPPPLSRQFQTYSVTLGPRVYLPIRWFELVGGLNYRRLGLTNNSLIRLTGPRTSFDAVGGSAGFRLRWSGFEIRVEGGGHKILQLPTTLYSADLLVGFTNPS